MPLSTVAALWLPGEVALLKRRDSGAQGCHQTILSGVNSKLLRQIPAKLSKEQGNRSPQAIRSVIVFAFRYLYCVAMLCLFFSDLLFY